MLWTTNGCASYCASYWMLFLHFSCKKNWIQPNPSIEKKIGDQISYDSKGFAGEQYFLVLTLHFFVIVLPNFLGVYVRKGPYSNSAYSFRFNC